MGLSCAVCRHENRPGSFFCAQCGAKLHFMEVPPARLTVMSRSGRGGKYLVTSRVCYIGREETNQVSIDDAALSKKHAKIVYSAGSFYIEDLGSRNGTFVNGDRVVRRSVLKDGDLIRLGLLILKFSLHPSDSADADEEAQRATLV